MDHLVTFLKEFTAVALAAVSAGFTIYNTFAVAWNKRSLIEHRRAIDALQLNAIPPGTQGAPGPTIPPGTVTPATINPKELP